MKLRMHRPAAIAAFFALGLSPATAQGKLTEVKFGTNWVAQAEHGGYYQAIADGTYEKYGLKVTIVPGGPQANNRMLLPVGRIDFYMGGNMVQALLGRRGEHPDPRRRGAFPEGPAGLPARIRTRATTPSRT